MKTVINLSVAIFGLLLLESQQCIHCFYLSLF